MKKSLALATIGAMTALSLTGCQAIEEFTKQDYNVRTIDDNLYSVEVFVPTESRVVYVREAAFNRAQDYCSALGKGAQLLDAYSDKVKSGGSKAKVIFRCVHYLKAPES